VNINKANIENNIYIRDETSNAQVKLPTLRQIQRSRRSYIKLYKEEVQRQGIGEAIRVRAIM